MQLAMIRKLVMSKRILGEGKVVWTNFFLMLVKDYLGKDWKLYAALMDLEKVYDRDDREALWHALNICGVGGQLMEGMKAFYREANVCVKIDGELDNFEIGVGVRQGCVILPWLFNIFMDGCMREMKAKVGNIGARQAELSHLVSCCHSAVDTMLLAESEMELQRVVEKFHRVCSRTKLRVNAEKSKEKL